MKKVLSIVFVVALLFTLFIPVMTATALNSPVGEAKYEVTVKADDANKGSVETVKGDDGKITIKATPKDGEKFYGWKITGEYTIISGSLTSLELVITPKSDIQAVAAFNEESLKDTSDSSDTSPETNDIAFAGVVVAFVAMVACAFVAKKRAFN